MTEHQAIEHRPDRVRQMPTIKTATNARDGRPNAMATSNYLALDLGAESGRGLLGSFDGERLRLEEVHRFANGPVRMADTLYWDLPRLFEEVKTALGKGTHGRCRTRRCRP